MSSIVSSVVAEAATIVGRFIEILSSDRSKQVVNVACGGCKQVNTVTIPKKIYHVVVAGGGGFGVFDSSTVADVFVLNVSGAVRSKAESLEEAVSTLALNIAQEHCTIIERA